jgi:hypothetical protein
MSDMTEYAFTLFTSLFEATTPGPHFINERCFGEDFAQWLRERLEAHAVLARDPIQEDWGWVLPVLFRSRRFTLSVGVMDESIGRIPSQWRIGVAYEKFLNGITAWFQPVPLADPSDLACIVESLLRSETRMNDVRRE